MLKLAFLFHQMVIKAADTMKLKQNIFVDAVAMATFKKGTEILQQTVYMEELPITLVLQVRGLL